MTFRHTTLGALASYDAGMNMHVATIADLANEARTIDFARKRVLGKSTGDDMETYSCYTARRKGDSERTGLAVDFSHRDDLLHHEMLWPIGARRFGDDLTMWRALNGVERHPRAQFAYEVVLALSSDVALEHNVAMLKLFAWEYRVRHGVPAQLDVHAGTSDPSGEPDGEDRANPHAHILFPTRELDADGFGAKTRHLNPPFWRNQVMQEEELRRIWIDTQRLYCAQHGIALRVDPTGFIAQPHMGSPAVRSARADRLETLELIQAANAALACDPQQVLAKLTKCNATFDDDDLDRLLEKSLRTVPHGADRRSVARAEVLAHPDLVPLFDKASGDWSGRYSTRTVRAQEARGMTFAMSLAAQSGGSADRDAVMKARDAHREVLTQTDQGSAFEYLTAPGKLKLLRGRAGTGKTRTLAAVRAAHEDADERGSPRRRVIGLSHMHRVKEALRSEGFAEVYTVEHMLNALQKTDGAIWDGVAMIAVDEAAMLSTRQLAGAPADGDKPATLGLLGWADRTGTKLVLVGDDRQLPSIERGGLFTEIAHALDQEADYREAQALKDGASGAGSGDAVRPRTLTKVWRQDAPWQRRMAERLADYEFDGAVEDLAHPPTADPKAPEAGRIHWSATQELAIDDLVKTWAQDLAPTANGVPARLDDRFVFAFTHREVEALNGGMRSVCRATGRLTGPDVPLDVCYQQSNEGEAEELHERVPFAEGDRIQFTKTDAAAEIHNGRLATITRIRPFVSHDGARAWAIKAWVGGEDVGHEVSWTSDAFNGIRHGYAGTGWGAQGKTIDRTYLLFGPHWRAPLSYMLLTRQKKDLKLFVASPDGAADRAWLAQAMARADVTSAAIAYDMSSTAGSDDARAGDSVALAGFSDASGPKSTLTGSSSIAIRTRGREAVSRIVERRRAERQALIRSSIADWDHRLAAFRHALADGANDRKLELAGDAVIAWCRDLERHAAWMPGETRRDPFASDLLERPELAVVLAAGSREHAARTVLADIKEHHRASDRTDSSAAKPFFDTRKRDRPRSR